MQKVHRCVVCIVVAECMLTSDRNMLRCRCSCQSLMSLYLVVQHGPSILDLLCVCHSSRDFKEPSLAIMARLGFCHT